MNENKKLMSGIKSKLLAAVCMLLVAVIMVVSSTYAWFTLSTAPEVTGITTAVGANGALEMVLVKYVEGEPVHSDAIVDTDDQSVINNIWGNLVDVSDNTKYGLDQITLYPSKLNFDEQTGTFPSTALLTPEYGSDGRIMGINPNGVIGAIASGTGGTGKFYATSALNSTGIRAVGVASGMTDRQLDYRNSLAAANTATSQAKNLAASTLNKNGGTLANIVIKKVTGDATYTEADVDSLDTLVIALRDQVIPQIETAYKQYILSLAASKLGTEAGYEAVKGLVNNASNTLYYIVDQLGTYVSLGSIADYIDALEITKGKIVTAADQLNTMQSYTAEQITWDGTTEYIGLTTPISNLAVVDSMKVNGYTAAQIKADMNLLVNSVVGGAGITVQIENNGGVYADIATHCGNFSAGIVIPEVNVSSLNLTNVDARMETKVSGEGVPYLSTFENMAKAALPPDGAAQGEMPITEFYGYIIDLGFRTNAAESNLLLQTAAIDRIYAENDSTSASYGGGSTMTFASTTPSFTDDNVIALMQHIRIVFFTPGDTTNTVLAYAKLDLSDGAYTTTADGITAPIRLYEEVPYYTVDPFAVIEGASVPVYERENNYYTDATAGDLVEATNVITRVYSNDGGTTLYSDIDCNKVVALPEGVSLPEEVTGVETHVITERNDSIITNLPQNKEAYVSVLVYLDGETITNKDVAATAKSSMKGSMNLQFASSSTLIPMDYAELQQSSSEDDEG